MAAPSAPRWERWHADAVAPRLKILARLPAAGGLLVASLVAVNLVLGLLPVGFVVATSVLVGRVPDAVGEGLGSSGWDALVAAFLVTAGLFLAQQVLTPVQTALGELVRRRVDGRVHDRLIAAASGGDGIAPLEEQRTLDALQEATRQLERAFHTPGMAAAGLLALIARYTQLTGFVALVGAVVAWPAAAALLLAVGAFRYGQRGGMRKYSRVWSRLAPIERCRDYFRALALAGGAAMEIRVFGLGRWLTERYAAKYQEVLRPVWQARRRIYLWPYLGYTAVGLTVVAFVFADIARRGALGSVSLTAVVVAVQATVSAVLLGAFYPEADVQTQFGMDSVRGMEEFERLVGGHDARPAAPEPTVAQPPTLARHVRFVAVTFAYPGAARPVFRGVDLELPARRCTAVVGLNGAGKTTLVKLLTRLHEPTDGSVQADGVDVRDAPVEVWRRQIGVVFQDFVRYELSAGMNIALGAAHVPYDAGRVRRAAAAAGILDVLESLPRGLDTQLSRHYADGAELSGGQWQRVAIARVLYAREAGAQLLVLDEPTAALDVRAEAAFFERIVEAARGATLLLISHRFSTVRRADRIAVLEGGRIVEQGDHQELLAHGGRYAKLFSLQAERFTTTPPDRPGSRTPAGGG